MPCFPFKISKYIYLYIFFLYNICICLDICSGKIVVWICSDRAVWSRLKSRGTSTLVRSLVHIEPAVKLLVLSSEGFNTALEETVGLRPVRLPLHQLLLQRWDLQSQILHAQKFKHNTLSIFWMEIRYWKHLSVRQYKKNQCHSVVPWRKLNIYKTFPLHKKFFKVEKGS